MWKHYLDCLYLSNKQVLIDARRYDRQVVLPIPSFIWSCLAGLHEQYECTDYHRSRVIHNTFKASGQIRPQAKPRAQTTESQATAPCKCLTTRVSRLQGLCFDTVRERVSASDCTKQRKFSKIAKVNWKEILDVLLPLAMWRGSAMKLGMQVFP